MYVEAIAPQATDDLLANYEASVKFGSSLPDEEIVLRYTGAIEEKMRKFASYLSKGIVRPQDAYVIAISGANIPQSSIEAWPFPRILKPLFAIGEPYLTIPIGGDGESTTGVHRREERRTANGGPVSCTIFSPNGHRNLSAVIFAPWDIKNRPESYGRPPGDDFLVIHNPNALNPMPEGTLPRGCEWSVRDGYLKLIVDRRTGVAA